MSTAERFFSAAQLSRIQEIGFLGMTSSVSIFRRTTTTDVYGDLAEVTFVETAASRRGTIKGWLFSSPTPVQEIDTGAIVTVNTYRLFLPVGTDIEPGDHVHVGADEYTVSDTTRETTWPALLAASLRRRE